MGTQRNPTPRLALSLPCLVAIALLAAAALAQIPRVREPVAALPNLSVEKIEFRVVRQDTWADGTTPCQHFFLIPTIANKGPRDATAFSVRVERKLAAWEPIPTATYQIAGLRSQERRELAERHFNNCGPGAPTTFRIVIDPMGQREWNSENNTMEKTYTPPIPKPPKVPVVAHPTPGGN